LLARKVHKARKDQPMGHKVHKVPKEFKELALKVPLDPRARADHKAQPELKGQPVLKELQGLKVLLVPKVQPGLKVLLVPQAAKAQPELKGQPAAKVRLAHKEQLAPKVFRELVFKERPVRKEQLALRAHKVHKAHREARAIKATKESLGSFTTKLRPPQATQLALEPKRLPLQTLARITRDKGFVCLRPVQPTGLKDRLLRTRQTRPLPSPLTCRQEPEPSPLGRFDPLETLLKITLVTLQRPSTPRLLREPFCHCR
jgi:hypothetical protein